MTDDRFEQFLEETKKRTARAESRRRFLRGTTQEIIGEIPEESLDAA